jgi:hypothetical protein
LLHVGEILKKKEQAAAYPLKQHVFEALNPAVLIEQPAPAGLAASACYCGRVTIVIATTPNNPSAAAMAITTVYVDCFALTRSAKTSLFVYWVNGQNKEEKKKGKADVLSSSVIILWLVSECKCLFVSLHVSFCLSCL